jgi:NAD(P)H dehydrogenase (quinone)
MARNAVVIFAHPNPQSLNGAIKDAVVDTLKGKGFSVTVRDLYAMGFDPKLTVKDFQAMAGGGYAPDVAVEQKLISEAEVIAFVHPIWWFSMPAVLKGYVERVLVRGFAYDYIPGGIKGLLAGKKVVVVNTTGGVKENYEGGMKQAMASTIDNGIIAFCGMTVSAHIFLHGVMQKPREELSQEIAAAKEAITHVL